MAFTTTMEALAFWQRVVHRSLLELDQDLSTRQMAILLAVYLEQKQHTIRSLAAELRISKAAVCRAVDMLSAAGFVKRKKDEADRRNVFIQRTIQGSVFLSDVADILLDEHAPQSEKEMLAA